MVHRLLVAFCLAAPILGCSSGASRSDSVGGCAVSGNVTLDGKPLQEGEVYFSIPGLVPRMFPIRNGAFAGRAREGVHRVQICAYRPRKKESQPPMPMTGLQPPPENYIPARFNVESTLTATVRADGSNTFDFAVVQEKDRASIRPRP